MSWSPTLLLSVCGLVWPTVVHTAHAKNGSNAATHASHTKTPIIAADSVRVVRSVRVYSQPRVRSKLNRGRVTRRARFRVLERRPRGHGCRRAWLRIGKHAWICSRATKPTRAAPSDVALPRLRRKRLLPHTYVIAKNARAYESMADASTRTGGKKLAAFSGFSVRGVRRLDGTSYVKTSEGWLAQPRARIVRPSKFRGVALDHNSRSRRLAFVTARRAHIYDKRGKRTATRSRPRQFFIGHVGPRQRIGRHTLRADAAGNYYRDDDLGLVILSTRPKGVTTTERWIDVVLSQQTMVAYDGDRPVLATLVSTARTATPKGVFRITTKRAVARMRSSFKGRNSWDVLTPWVMTLRGPIAMHATYSHKQFGKPRSHGCINLSPRDAKWVWEFTEPQLPPGWTRIETVAPAKGTLIRVR